MPINEFLGMRSVDPRLSGQCNIFILFLRTFVVKKLSHIFLSTLETRTTTHQLQMLRDPLDN
jgi:hypothetical protein